MIAPSKAAQALYALNGVLVQLRFLALRGEDPVRIAAILDVIEMLPRLLSTPDDRTNEFEGYLRGLAESYPGFGIGLARFLEDTVPDTW
jgi:hypothetical protein